MRRANALSTIYAELESCVVVTIMGAVATELYALGHRPNFFISNTPWDWRRRWGWASR